MLDHQIKMGRDALFDLLAANSLLVRRRKNRMRTTNSFHWLRKYPNLIKEFAPLSVNQLWVSDITYWKTSIGYLYISFITDAYSHKIVGFRVDKTLEAAASVKALKMAIREATGSLNGLIHHSDRGLQYCSGEYVKVLKRHKVKISMTENGDPKQNAVAERINGIIKGEYLENYQVNSLKQARKLLRQTIRLYNSERPHMSINNRIPSEIHQSKNIEVLRKWKNYYPNNKPTVNQYQD